MASTNHTITAEYLRSILHYDPNTGIFTWRWREDVRASANCHFAYKEAGCVSPRSGGRFYRQIRVCGRLYYAHRLAHLWMTGEWPPEEIDHRDRNGLNNRWTNLRSASGSDNHANSATRLRNKLGVKGVYIYDDRIRASITRNKCVHHLGIFDSIDEAHAAYCKAALELHGEFARFE